MTIKTGEDRYSTVNTNPMPSTNYLFLDFSAAHIITRERSYGFLRCRMCLMYYLRIQNRWIVKFFDWAWSLLMGIPKLSRDLEPYREHVVLGIGCSNPQADRISRLVIDGPGLVYFVYHQLLAMGDRKANPFDAQPSCAEVCETVRSLLLAFQNQGVEMYAMQSYQHRSCANVL